MQKLLNEAYFGKTSEILQIEKIVEKYRSKYNISDIYKADLVNDPLKFELGKAIENAFGFEVVDIQIIQMSTMNACTMPIGYKLDTLPSKNLVVHHKTGFKYKKEAGYALIVNITSGLLLYPNITASEITAVLLHEIGHNFTPGIFMMHGIFGKIRIISLLAIDFIQIGPTAAEELLSLTNCTDKIKIHLSKWVLENMPTFTNVLSSINGLFSAFRDINKFLIDILSAFSPISNAIYYGMISLVKTLTDPIGLFIGNTDENFADSFAEMYGYGEELSSVLPKLERNSDTFNQVIKNYSLINNIYQLTLIPVMLLVGVFDPHSNSCVRSIKILENLEYELQHNNCSPKLKKRLKQDIIKVKASIDRAYIRIESSNDPHTIEKLWAQFLLQSKCYKLYDAVLNKATPEDISNAIIKKEKKSFNNIHFK